MTAPVTVEVKPVTVAAISKYSLHQAAIYLRKWDMKAAESCACLVTQ